MKIAVWKLVPIDPTEQQLAAVRGKQHPNRPDRWDSNNRRIYQAMIAAAPAAAPVDKSTELQGSQVDKTANPQGSAAVAVPVELLERVIDSLSSFAGNKPHTEADMAAWEQLNDLLSAAPAAVAVPDEREAFEAFARKYGTWDIKRDDVPHLGIFSYTDVVLVVAWHVWQARAALAATPAADAPAWDGKLPERLQIALNALRMECPAADIGGLEFEVRRTFEALETSRATAQRMFGAARDRLAEIDAMPFDPFAAAAPVVLPEPEAAIKEVMGLVEALAFSSVDYGHKRAFIDPECEAARKEAGQAHRAVESKLRALLATGGQAQAVERGEVLVTVSGFTGSGKSAIAGEIEILCRALGLQVEWPDGDSEKNMTHADWTAALEQYKPRVHIVEQNIPFAAMKGMSK